MLRLPKPSRLARLVARREQARRDLIERRTTLIELGKMRALWATMNWDERDKQEARADVRDALEAGVEGDWSDQDVDELGDEVLNEWAEDLDE